MERHHHSEESKRAVINRLSRAIGHLESVKRMVEEDKDCSEVLIQIAAVQAAINNTGKVILKEHTNHCIVHAVEEGETKALADLNSAIDKLSNKTGQKRLDQSDFFWLSFYKS